MSFFHSLGSSFKHAWDGLMVAFKEEQSFRIQLFAGLLVAVLALFLPLQRWERSIVILVIAAVLVLELLNSIVERFVDMLKPRVHEYARQIKDLSAAVVFLVALTAVILAIVIFWPYLYLLVRL
ncbi:MAG: diacylglycerol kinase [Patescibacteria group bacterium]|jgi:diacylglycerol kinase